MQIKMCISDGVYLSVKLMEKLNVKFKLNQNQGCTIIIKISNMDQSPISSFCKGVQRKFTEQIYLK